MRAALIRIAIVSGALAPLAHAEPTASPVAWADLSASRGVMLLTENTRLREPWQLSLELGGFLRDRLGLGVRAYLDWQPHETSSWPSMYAVGAQVVGQYWLDDRWVVDAGIGFGYWWFCCDSMTTDPDSRGHSTTIPLEAGIRYMHGFWGAGLTLMTSTVPLEPADTSATFHWATVLLSMHVRGTDHR